MEEYEAAQTLAQITGWGNALAWILAALAAIVGVLLARRARVPIAGPGVLAAGIVVLAASTFALSVLELVASELGQTYSVVMAAAMVLDLLATLACVVGLALLTRPRPEPATAEAGS